RTAAARRVGEKALRARMSASRETRGLVGTLSRLRLGAQEPGRPRRRTTRPSMRRSAHGERIGRLRESGVPVSTRLRAVAASALLVACVAAQADAQPTTSSITGRALDATGAVLPGVRVRARHLET